jgi:hypothetical protein
LFVKGRAVWRVDAGMMRPIIQDVCGRIAATLLCLALLTAWAPLNAAPGSADRIATVTRAARSLADSGGLSLPGSLVLEYGVENREKLVHARYQRHFRHFLRFACR